jgi:D-lyxose ketol-isomerase
MTPRNGYGGTGAMGRREKNDDELEQREPGGWKRAGIPPPQYPVSNVGRKVYLMKRSEINAAIRLAKGVFDAHGFKLPPWGYWGPEEWKNAGPEAQEIRDAMLGWDITDFGGGEFLKNGLVLFTIRNGNLKKPSSAKTYAEKIMLVQPHQVTPMHFHWVKMEDIINRGGGELVLKLFNSLPDEKPDPVSDVRVSVDGIERTTKPGGLVRLAPGESITLTRGLYHEFWAEGAPCMVGEVSMVNNDTSDNRFYPPVGRFPEIEEDEAPIHLLGNEVPQSDLAAGAGDGDVALPPDPEPVPAALFMACAD